MTLRLTIDAAAWRAHVDHVVASYSGGPIVPVVKGNGYGFGRSVLARVAEDIVAAQRHTNVPPSIAVGTTHELAGVPSRLRPVVLTPPGAGANQRWRSVPGHPIVTIGDDAHVHALDGWRGDVLVKLASSMRRFGVAPRELDDFERSARVAGLNVVGYSIHLPTAGDDAERTAEVERWLTALATRRRIPDSASAVWVSHLGPDAYGALAGPLARLAVATAARYGVVARRQVDAPSRGGRP